MATDKYDLHTIDYSVQGWDSILATDMEKLDEVIHSRIKITVGETIAQYDVVYLASNGKCSKAQADGVHQPAVGVALVSAVLDDEIRIQRLGPITNPAWAWATIGVPVYLDPSTPGAITDVSPGVHVQRVGLVLSATSIFAWTDLIGTGNLQNLVEDLTPQLGGPLEMNEKTILVDAVLADDHSWTGPTQEVTVGEQVTIFSTLYLKADGKYWKIDADAEATAKGKIVMATATINADASGLVLLPSALSFIRDDSTGKWTVTGAGDEMFLSLTAGRLTNDVSAYSTGDIVRIAGYMETAVILNFNVDKTYIEIA